MRELKLNCSRKLNAECIIQGLKNSRSLKRLDIYGVRQGDLIFARLFRILPDCPLIDCIGLPGWFSEEDLAQVKLLPRLPRPIKLDLPKPDFPDSILRIVELLRCHPEVRMPRGYNFLGARKDAFKTEFLHAVNMNWHGRYLLDRPNVPLSIWPLVLEKVNDNKAMDEDEQANVIYELLNGPAGFGRTSF